ncbi:50S ribosomal protein L19 [Candidatus Roizmanbacteria bacterium]|nr:50S ribosomal protein L19 [Candidatus Roizmanbacteria bacterium]
MANSFVFKDKTFTLGSTIGVTYKFKEGDKERKQIFKGVLIKIKGNTPQTKMITVRKVSRSGIGVERIIPLISPFLNEISIVKKAEPGKAKLYYIRKLTEQQVKHKL